MRALQGALDGPGTMAALLHCITLFYLTTFTILLFLR